MMKNSRTVLYALLALFGTLGAPRPGWARDPWEEEERSKQVLAEGLRLEKERDFDGATKKYLEGYQHNRDKIDFLVLAGEACAKSGQLADALEHFEEYRQKLDRVKADKSFTANPRWSASLRKAKRRRYDEAVKLLQDRPRLLKVLQADYLDLDKAIEEQRRKEGAKAELLLLQGRTKLYLEQWEASVDALERYQMHEPKPAAAKLEAAYRRLAEALPEVQRQQEQEQEHPKAPPPALLLRGRVQVGLYRLNPADVGPLDPAVAYYESYRVPDEKYGKPNRDYLKGLPPPEPERQHYAGLVQVLTEAREKNKSSPRLRLLLGCAHQLAGEPKAAQGQLSGLEAALEPGDLQHYGRCHGDSRIALQKPIWKKWQFWLGMGLGVVAVGTAVGLGVGLTQSGPDIEFMNYSLRSGRR